jgi:transposase
MIGALSLQGLDAVMTVDRATDGDVFRVYVEQVLGPTLVAGDVVIMDNLGAHQVAGSARSLSSVGRRCSICPLFPRPLAH